MSRYIDADKIEFKPVEVVFECKSYTLSEFFAHKKAVDKIPTADVEPVRHGHWLKDRYAAFRYLCSLCGWAEDMETNYCSECGAKMDEENEK